MTTKSMLKLLAFTMACGIVGYILFLLIMWAIALIQIGVWAFVLAAGGGASG